MLDSLAIAELSRYITPELASGLVTSLVGILGFAAQRIITWALKKKTTKWYWNNTTKKFAVKWFWSILAKIISKDILKGKIDYEVEPDHIPQAQEELKEYLKKKYPLLQIEVKKE